MPHRFEVWQAAKSSQIAYLFSLVLYPIDRTRFQTHFIFITVVEEEKGFRVDSANAIPVALLEMTEISCEDFIKHSYDKPEFAKG
jgi:hypothetical protein